jgi:dTDP-4-amino-4,6-dideoxygalactose transaminase
MLCYSFNFIKQKEMSAQGVYRITEDFERAVAKYTNAPYAIAIDNCSNAIFLALKYFDVAGLEIEIPERTYMSVPCEIIRAGGTVKFNRVEGDSITGEYQLMPTTVWDSALLFTSNMYRPSHLQCLSFTGPYKTLKLSKAGMILTDDKKAYQWFKRARFSGRNECGYHEDYFDCLGYNMYLLPEISARGLLLMNQFYDSFGNPISNSPVTMRYPKLSDFKIYTNAAADRLSTQSKVK